jgi:hypothetical protein
MVAGRNLVGSSYFNCNFNQPFPWSLLTMSMIRKAGCCMMAGAALWASNAVATQIITQPFLGIEHVYATETSPRPLKINVAIIDLTAPGIRFEMTPRAANYPGPIINGSPGETKRQTTRQFADAVGAQVAINGSYYATTSSDISWANNLGLTASNGDHYSPWENPFSFPATEFRDGLNITQDNQAQIVKMPSSIPTGFETTPTVPLYNTVTGYARLVQNGSNVALSSCDQCGLNPRTSVGITADNKLVMMAVDGRETGYSEGLTMVETANFMMSYGAVDAIDLDGGGSTTMVMNYYGDQTASQVLNVPSDGSERSVGDNLAVFALPNGDYNQNGVVDAADYVTWRSSIGGQLAYDAWRSQFGTVAGGLGGGSAVPEPTSICLALLAVLSFIRLRVLRTGTTARCCYALQASKASFDQSLFPLIDRKRPRY